MLGVHTWVLIKLPGFLSLPHASLLVVFCLLAKCVQVRCTRWCLSELLLEYSIKMNPKIWSWLVCHIRCSRANADFASLSDSAGSELSLGRMSAADQGLIFCSKLCLSCPATGPTRATSSTVPVWQQCACVYYAQSCCLVADITEATSLSNLLLANYVDSARPLTLEASEHQSVLASAAVLPINKSMKLQASAQSQATDSVPRCYKKASFKLHD